MKAKNFSSGNDEGMITGSRNAGNRYRSEKLEDPGKQFVTRGLYGRHKLTAWCSHLFQHFAGDPVAGLQCNFILLVQGLHLLKTMILDSARRVPAADEAI